MPGAAVPFALVWQTLSRLHWVWEYQPTALNNLALVAYIRLKVANNTSVNQVARVAIKSGDTEYGPLVLRGIDFAAANQYQEFALPFVYRAGDPFLTFQFWRSGSTEVFVDGVTLFSAPRPITNPFTLDMFGGNYRGQGIWVRYTNGVTFSDFNTISADRDSCSINTCVTSEPTVLADNHDSLCTNRDAGNSK
jgi:hypothetical protein